MNWYTAEDKAKNVREVVVQMTQPLPIKSTFGKLMLGSIRSYQRAAFTTVSSASISAQQVVVADGNFSNGTP
jgi:hypothetical protein